MSSNGLYNQVGNADPRSSWPMKRFYYFRVVFDCPLQRVLTPGDRRGGWPV